MQQLLYALTLLSRPVGREKQREVNRNELPKYATGGSKYFGE